MSSYRRPRLAQPDSVSLCRCRWPGPERVGKNGRQWVSKARTRPEPWQAPGVQLCLSTEQGSWGQLSSGRIGKKRGQGKAWAMGLCGNSETNRINPRHGESSWARQGHPNPVTHRGALWGGAGCALHRPRGHHPHHRHWRGTHLLQHFFRGRCPGSWWQPKNQTDRVQNPILWL